MKHIYISLILLANCMQLFATDFSDKQNAIIYNEAIKTMQAYEQMSNQMADAVIDMDELNKSSQHLIDLFVNRKVIIYNDLDPNQLLSEAYELETYINNLLLWYPDGMKINIDFDQLKAGNIISHGNSIYTVDLMLNKQNNGNYLNRQKNELNESLLYRIAFYQKGGSFLNFKIAGIRSSTSLQKNNDAHLLSAVKSVSFSEKEKQVIHRQTKGLLNDYVNYINLLTDPEEVEDDKVYYRISFFDLFKDTTIRVANDFEPEPTQQWLPVTNYQRNLEASYPTGIRNMGLNIDSMEFSEIIAESDELFYVNGYINKFFSGKYENKTVFRDNNKYDFKITFEKDDNTFKNFKLASIDKFGVNFYDQNESISEQALPNRSVSSIEREGFYFGASIGAGLSAYKNPNFTNHPMLAWSLKNRYAFSIEAYTTYYIKSQIGISAGLAYNQYNANLNLEGDYQSTAYFNDLANQSHLKNIAVNYDSLLTFNYIDLPIKIVFHSNKSPEKWGIYAEVGVITSLLINANYEASGSFSSSGYYEQNPEGAQIIDAQSRGFINRDAINEQGKANAKPINISALTAIGISYPIDYFTSISAGIEAYWGLSNISKDNEFTDAFGNKTQAEKVTLSKYGVKFGISHKF